MKHFKIFCCWFFLLMLRSTSNGQQLFVDESFENLFDTPGTATCAFVAYSHEFNIQNKLTSTKTFVTGNKSNYDQRYWIHDMIYNQCITPMDGSKSIMLVRTKSGITGPGPPFQFYHASIGGLSLKLKRNIEPGLMYCIRFFAFCRIGYSSALQVGISNSDTLFGKRLLTVLPPDTAPWYWGSNPTLYWAKFLNVLKPDTGGLYLTLMPDNDTSKVGTVNLDHFTLYPARGTGLTKMYLCRGDSAHLEAKLHGVSYDWVRPTGARLDETGPSIYTRDSGWHISFVYSTDTAFVDSIYIQLIDSGMKTMPAIEATYCNDSTFVLKGEGANNRYLWNTTDTLSQISPGIAGTYWVQTFFPAGCSQVDTFKIKIQAPAQLPLPDDSAFCPGSIIVLNAYTPGYSKYLWNTGDTLSLVNIAIAGTYVIKAGNGICNTADTIHMKQWPLSNPGLPQNTEHCFTTGPLKIRATPGHRSYSWLHSAEQGHEISITQPSTYTLSIIDTNGCASSDSMKITECTSGIYIPNAFTPDGDGLNDVFCLRGSQIVQSKLRIFSRANEEIYTSENYLHCWDGTFKNEPCQSGTYMYILTYRLATSAGEKVAKGNVMLLR